MGHDAPGLVIGSRRLARGFGLGVSPATIRQTMSELEEKGYLFHPHTSAGRIPTDKGSHGLTYFPTSRGTRSVGHNGVYLLD